MALRFILIPNSDDLAPSMVQILFSANINSDLEEIEAVVYDCGNLRRRLLGDGVSTCVVLRGFTECRGNSENYPMYSEFLLDDPYLTVCGGEGLTLLERAAGGISDKLSERMKLGAIIDEAYDDSKFLYLEGGFSAMISFLRLSGSVQPGFYDPEFKFVRRSISMPVVFF